MRQQTKSALKLDKWTSVDDEMRAVRRKKRLQWKIKGITITPKCIEADKTVQNLIRYVKQVPEVTGKKKTNSIRTKTAIKMNETVADNERMAKAGNNV